MCSGKIVFDLDCNKWDSYSNLIPNSTFYHSWNWTELTRKVYGHLPIRIAIEGDGHVRGIFPLSLVRNFPFVQKLVSLPFSPYGGPVAETSEEYQILLNTALRIAKQLQAQVEIRAFDPLNPSVIRDDRLHRLDYYVTYTLDLQKSLDLIWKDFGKTMRNLARRAEKEEYAIELSNDELSIDDFYWFYLQSMKRLGTPPHSRKFFHIMREIFPKNFVLVFVTQAGKRLGAQILFRYKNRVTSAYSVYGEADVHSAVNYALYWEVIKWSKINGFSFLDMGRTRPGSGVMAFKERLGATKTPIPYYLTRNIDQRSLAENQYNFVSRAWKYLPFQISEALGPYIRSRGV